jgi:hypothetical protein
MSSLVFFPKEVVSRGRRSAAAVERPAIGFESGSCRRRSGTARPGQKAPKSSLSSSTTTSVRPAVSHASL